MNAKYRRQGGRYYKVRGHVTVEIDMNQEEYKTYSINVCDNRINRMDSPNKKAEIITKTDFDKVYNKVMDLINKANTIKI